MSDLDFQTVLDNQRTAFEQQLVNTVLGASRALQPDEVEIRREYDLDAPIDILTTPSASAPVRVERIRVVKRVFPLAPVGTDEAEDWYEARGYGRPLTKQGKVSQRESANWYFLPDAVARQLLGHVNP